MVNNKISLDDKYALGTTRAYMTGIEALVRLPMLQHQRDLDRGLNTAGFISGYRGSPLGGLDQALWQAEPYLSKHHIHFQPGINEDLAATAVWGSQQVNLFEGARYDGVFGLWYGKGPGVDRSMDVIRHANAFGTSRYDGVLAVAGDDHAAKSSTLPHQSEHMFIGASIPVLNPANVQEVLDLGIYGWELSRYCGCWVALKAITENMDSAIAAEIDPQRIHIQLPDSFELPVDGVHARWPDNALAQERRLNKYKIYAAREFARVNQLNRIIIDSEKPRLGIITTGKAYLDVMQALEDLGIDQQKACAIGLRIFKVGMSWPLEPISTHQFADGLEEILVVEEKRSIIEDQLTGQLYNWPVERRPRVIGEFDELGNDLLPNLSELTPALVARAIAARLRRYYQDAMIERRLSFYEQKERSLAQPRSNVIRMPHYCSGCPHSTSTRVPEGSKAMAGIGCHYMGIWEKGDRAAQTFTQMGGEGITWVGQAPFTDTPHMFQNLGDGTYFHSGLLAIRQAHAAGVNITYKILYNDAVAMTGGQPIDGQMSVAQMVEQLRGEGVKRIAVVSDNPAQHRAILSKREGLTIDHRDRLLAVEKTLREISGTTVLIYEQTCAAEKRRRRKKGLLADPPKRVVINAELCEGCGDCSVQSNCLSVLPKETELGRKREIDQSACNKDYSCLNGFCPSLVTIHGGKLRKKRGIQDARNFRELPEPTLADIEERPWNIVVTGVGGTGVLTVASLVAMAAYIEGKGCATMNQTGLAQKFGSVVSHVRVGKTQDAINAVRIPAGDADLLLGCDLVVASGNEAMAKANIERSFAVVNDYESATAEFVSNPDAEFPAEAMKATICEEVGAEKVHFLDATSIARELLGDSIGSNLFLLGYAYQQGLLPVSAQALTEAIRLNNVAVEFNLQAFLWGRRAAVNKVAVIDAAAIEAPAKKLQTYSEIIEDRCARLVAYQNREYADLYRQRVAAIHQAEQAVMGTDEQRLAISVAESLYALMAYKDEYEVARLLSSDAFRQQLEEQFEGDYRVQYHLAPPLFSRRNPDTGLPVKSAFPQWTAWLFKGLAKLKILRGTVFDPFAFSEDRKLERQLLQDYVDLLGVIEQNLSSDNYTQALALSGLVRKVRGFGHVKARAIKHYHQQLRPLLQQFLGKTADNIKFVDAAA